MYFQVHISVDQDPCVNLSMKVKNGPCPASFWFIFVFSNIHYNFTVQGFEPTTYGI